MTYNEQTAKELIEKYQLSHSTMKVWKSRNAIPDKYLNPDYAKPEKVSKADNIRLSRLQEISKTGKLNISVIAELAKVEVGRLNDAIRGKGLITTEELDRVDVEIKKVHALVKNNIDKNDTNKLKKIFDCKAIKYYKVCGKDEWAKNTYYALRKENQLSQSDYIKLKDYYTIFIIETNL